MVASFLRAGKTRTTIAWCVLLSWCVLRVGQSGAEEGRPRTLYAQYKTPALVEEDLLPHHPSDDDTATIPSAEDPVVPPIDSHDTRAPSSLETSSPPVQVALSPQDLVALRFVEGGRALLEQAQFELARERFEEAVAVAPQQPYGYYFLGRLTFLQGDHQQALAFLHKAELLFGANDRAWRGEAACLRGAIYEELRDDHQARMAYRQCLELMPRNLRALSALARLQTEEFLPSDEYAPPDSAADPWD